MLVFRWTEQDPEFFCGRTLAQQIDIERRFQVFLRTPGMEIGFKNTPLDPYGVGSKWYRAEDYHRKQRAIRAEGGPTQPPISLTASQSEDQMDLEPGSRPPRF